MRNLEILIIDYDRKETHHFRDVSLSMILRIYRCIRTNRKLVASAHHIGTKKRYEKTPKEFFHD